MSFEILGRITDIETIAKGRGVRDLRRLRKCHGKGSWRKLKGIADIRLETGRVRRASHELHKIYRVLEDEDVAVDGDVRVIDESGEDYIYPASFFAAIEVPLVVAESLLKAS